MYDSTFMILIFGLTLSPIPFGGSVGSVDLEIPAIFESPMYLNEPSTWISAAGAAGKGPSFTSTSLGYAYGEIEFSGNEVKGFDIGLDMMLGISICRTGCS
jgi:hypothetical protein